MARPINQMRSWPKSSQWTWGQDFAQNCTKDGKKVRLQPDGYFRQDGMLEVPAEPGAEEEKDPPAAAQSHWYLSLSRTYVSSLRAAAYCDTLKHQYHYVFPHFIKLSMKQNV